MARCGCCRNIYGFGQIYFSCILSNGHCDRVSLSGLRDDTLAFFSCDGKDREIFMDTSDGHSDCLPHSLLFVEPLYIGEKCQRNKSAGHYGDHSAGRAVCLANVSFFPGQTALCLSKR